MMASVEDMINTVVRQFHSMNLNAWHEGRKAANYPPEQLNEFWLTTSRESLGKAVLDGDIRLFLVIYPPLYPFAVLCLCLCIWRLLSQCSLWCL